MNSYILKVLKFFNLEGEAMKNYIISLFLTIVITYGAIFIFRFLVSQFFNRTHFVSEKKQETIHSLIKNTSHYVAFIVIGLAIINPFIDIKQIMVAGGVVGVVLGFGAQSLIRDILSGSFMIFERTIQKGDFVHINGESEGGTVEEVGFRVIKIRLTNGKLLTIPNGEIKKIVNGSVERRRIFESVIVSFDENPMQIKEYLEEVCMALNEKHKDLLHIDKLGTLIENYRVYGLSSLDTSPLGYKFSITATVNDIHYLQAAQETKEFIAQKLYENKVKMPTQQLVMRNQS